MEQTRRDWRKLPPVTETSSALHCYSLHLFVTVFYCLLLFATVCYCLLLFVTVCYCLILFVMFVIVCYYLYTVWYYFGYSVRLTQHSNITVEQNYQKRQDRNPWCYIVIDSSVSLEWCSYLCQSVCLNASTWGCNHV